MIPTESLRKVVHEAASECQITKMTAASHPLISIIVATYNAELTLQQCIDSVAQQTYKKIELIVIDGASTDRTGLILSTNSRHIHYWVSEPDQGIYDAWNKGLTRSNGEWIFFLGADDYLWDAAALEKMVSALITLPPIIRIAYGQIMLVNSTGEEMFTLGKPWKFVKTRFKQTMCIPHPAVMHRRELFAQNGQFDTSFQIAGDYELLLRELSDGDAVFIPNIILTAMRQGGVSSDPNKTLLVLSEVRAAQRKNGILFPGVLWIMAILRVYVRKAIWFLVGEVYARRILDAGRRIMRLPAYWTRT